MIIEGINPQSLGGTETGVYIGLSSFGAHDGLPEEIQPDLESSAKYAFYNLNGRSLTLYANRISFVFDFKGPSMVVETGCSSSMVAMDLAITDLRLGMCTKLTKE